MSERAFLQFRGYFSSGPYNPFLLTPGYEEDVS